MVHVLRTFGGAAVAGLVSLTVSVVLAGVLAARGHGARSVLRVLAIGALVTAGLILVVPSGLQWLPARGDFKPVLGSDALKFLVRPDYTPDLRLLVLNAGVLVPWGVLGVLAEFRPTRVLLVATALVVGVEALQWLALDRVAATDDLVVNLAGAVVGVAAGLLVVRWRDWRRGERESPPVPAPEMSPVVVRTDA